MFVFGRVVRQGIRAIPNFYCSTVSSGYALKYSERPYTPAQFLSMSTSFIGEQDQSTDLEYLLHGMQLMHSEVTPFSYDLYQWTCSRLVLQQERLHKDEILLMLRLGVQYKVRIESFLTHMENELYLRVHRDYQGELEDYDRRVAQELKKIYAQLETQSGDCFGILKESELGDEQQNDGVVEEEGSEQQGQKEEVQELDEHRKWVVRMSQRLNSRSKGEKEIGLADLLEISELLRENGSKNLSFVQYLLELLTVHFESAPVVAVSQMLRYIKLTTFSCQGLMAEYYENKQRYTARSLKRIFKYQTFYYEQHQLQLEQTVAGMTDGEIEQLVDVYGVFPIKRREIRRRIGRVLCGEIAGRGLVGREGVMGKLIQINRKDEKMKRTFRELLGLPQPQIEQSTAKPIALDVAQPASQHSQSA